MGKSKAPEARMPTAAEIAPLVDLQAQYNRVGVSTPFGSQRYEVGPDGRSSTLVTDIGPEGRALVARAMGFANTDSNRMGVNPQIDGLAQALMNRVGSRFGMQPGQGMELSPRPNMPTAKPQPQAQMPQAPQIPQIPQNPQNPRFTTPTVGGNRPRGSFIDAIRMQVER